jgi:cyclic pyranopterin phosphate synthase
MELIDSYGRQIDYLRISITDHCNLNCLYCAPFGGRSKLSREEILSYEEIQRVVEAAVSAGISKVRLTGGEPLTRRGIVKLCRMLINLEALESLSLTTNGVLLQQLTAPLFAAGVRRINVSLDTLKPERFRTITGQNLLSHVLTGIKRAEEAGFDPIKINTVVMRGVNDDEVEDLARLTIKNPYHVRFVELMPTGCNVHGEHESLFVPMARIIRTVQKVGVLSLEPASDTFGPAKLCSLQGARGKIGFIAPLSWQFCGSCNRLRLTADGMLRSCLFSEEEIDVKGPLRAGASIKELANVFSMAAERKPHGHRIHKIDKKRDDMGHGRAMQAIGG